MKIGTRSVLFGAHQFLIHPWFVAWAWWRLYGFPWDPRLWVAFFVHDLGYLGKPNMDGDEGERHVELGAKIMNRLFDGGKHELEFEEWIYVAKGVWWRCNSEKFLEMLMEGWEVIAVLDSTTVLRRPVLAGPWTELCLYHSRFYAKQARKPHSRLCVADKLAICLEPWWFYLPRVFLTGEIKEYMSKAAMASGGKYTGERRDVSIARAWHRSMVDYLLAWVEKHKDGGDDTWTNAGRTTIGQSGVYQ